MVFKRVCDECFRYTAINRIVESSGIKNICNSCLESIIGNKKMENKMEINDMKYENDYCKNVHTEFVDCWCKEFEHSIRFVIYNYDKNDDVNGVEFYLEGFLISSFGFWKRLKSAWKYLWFKQWDDAPFTASGFSYDQAEQIINICKRYKKEYKKNLKKFGTYTSLPEK